MGRLDRFDKFNGYNSNMTADVMADIFELNNGWIVRADADDRHNITGEALLV